jgi:hypothetical protein
MEREMVIDLRRAMDFTFIGAMGELIAWKYLNSKGISVYRFGSTFYPGIHRNQTDLSDFLSQHLKSLNCQQVDYLKDIYKYESRMWDFIGLKYRYKSRYGRRKVEQAAFELRKAYRERDEEGIKIKEEMLEKLLQKFQILDLYLIEVKTRSSFSHDLEALKKGKGKLQKNIPYAKSLGFKPLIVVIEFLENWKFRVFCREL